MLISKGQNPRGGAEKIRPATPPYKAMDVKAHLSEPQEVGGTSYSKPRQCNQLTSFMNNAKPKIFNTNLLKNPSLRHPDRDSLLSVSLFYDLDQS